MDTKWKKFSHSIITKIIVFIIVIGCFTGAMTIFMNVVVQQKARFDIVFEDSYYRGNEYMSQSNEVIMSLTQLMGRYKSKEYILEGGSINNNDLEREVENLFSEFEWNSKYFNPNLSREENYAKFKEVYKDKLTQIKEDLIQRDLQEYDYQIQRLKEHEGIIYYVSNGENEITNSSNTSKEYFEKFPSYLIFDKNEEEVFPKEIKANRNYYWLLSDIDELHALDRLNGTVYFAFTEDYIISNIKEWKENKVIVTNSLYSIAASLLGFVLLFIYLILVVGRKSFKDKEVHFNIIDRLYNDINLGLCIGLVLLWIITVDTLWNTDIHKVVIPLTASITTVGLILILSLVKHFKNKTLLKHTLIYTIFNKIFKFIKDVYDNGSVAAKIVFIAIGYPVLVALTFFMFPITLGVGAWLALKQVKEFNAIKEGVKRIKDGDLNYTIDTTGKGELGRLSTNINDIGVGLKEAVDNELKSERLKTELITNVSHDIRTPLTSIITYVDLLKKEKDRSKSEEYIKILDQKSQRLKVLTDDLFQAAKASSGSIPVNFEKIDIVSLITQGLGELNDKIEASELSFKMNHPKDKVYITADGKLLWRAIENLLSNIFKYALNGSRVYIDIEDLGNEVRVIIKNISAYELNISADELMERFKRGDESRSSQGSGLGLSIAKSLIDIQKGNFHIEIDGDLFKAIIKMPRFEDQGIAYQQIENNDNAILLGNLHANSYFN